MNPPGSYAASGSPSASPVSSASAFSSSTRWRSRQARKLRSPSCRSTSATSSTRLSASRWGSRSIAPATSCSAFASCSFEHPVLDERIELVGENVPRQADSALEVFEPSRSSSGGRAAACPGARSPGRGGVARRRS
jgi:hypothetical protein